VAVPFFGFRIMVGIGLLMFALIIVSWWLRKQGRMFDARWFLRSCVLASPLGFLAVLAGWATTEVGRQPWTVYGLLRTADSVTPSLTGFDVVLSLAGYAIVYLIMFPAGIALMARIVRNGPVEPPLEEEPVVSGRPQYPVQALPVPEQRARS
jgi:cytochrome d ubiquinol oxidase subunit I